MHLLNMIEVQYRGNGLLNGGGKAGLGKVKWKFVVRE